MKSTILSLALLLSLLFLLANLSDAVVPCGTVDIKAASCVAYATGRNPNPSPACCSGLQQLAQTVRTVEDKKAICRCLKAGVRSFAGVQDRFLSRIPAACKINVGFPVSMSTNCEA